MSPEVEQHVMVHLPGGEGVPATVEAIDDASITLVVRVASPVPLDTLRAHEAAVEWTTRRGVHRIGCTIDEGTRLGTLRLRRVDSAEVVQRRDWFRVEAFVPATIVTRGEARQTLETTTIDISGGGIRINDPVGLTAGTEVDVALRVGPGDPVRAVGRVVRQTGAQQTAICITEMTRDDRQALVRHVNERERAALRVARGR